MSDPLRFTIHYSDGGDGWIMAQVEEVPAQSARAAPARKRASTFPDAPRLMPKPEPDNTADPDREPLKLTLTLTSTPARCSAICLSLAPRPSMAVEAKCP